MGVIAGAGALPRLVAEALRRRGEAAFVVALRGAAEPWVADWPHAWAALAQGGRIFRALRGAGCRQVCLAGAVSRPGVLAAIPDVATLAMAPRLLRLLRSGGDDGLLRAVAGIFEQRGFELTPAHAYLEDLLAPEGVLGARRPAARDLDDLRRARRIVAALGAVDVGQGAVVAAGRCLAVEAVSGTDAMLAKLVGETRRGGAPTPAGVLFKAPKPGQDRRFDMPAIGPTTLEGAKAAGLNGVAVEAGGVFLLDPARTVAAADRLGLFLYGAPKGAEEEAA
ncbi:MAG: UDP-2,3-diacylglucosamine diphosphatase LpxI [Pseudomonadota bacterium]